VAWDSLSTSTGRYSINLVRSEERGLFGPVATVVADALVSSPTLALSETAAYIGWDEWGFNSGPPHNTGGRLMMTSSSHTSIRFAKPQEIAETDIGFARRIASASGLSGAPNLSLTVDPQKDGHVYAAFADGSDRVRIHFARSSNHGKSWQVMPVSGNETGSHQISPAITVDSDGNVTISFYDARPGRESDSIDLFLARSMKKDSFGTQRVTTTSSNDSRLNLARDLAANVRDRTAVAMTARDVLAAWTDTRNGSEDIFFSILSDSDGVFR
jgi:hypothetical protein